MDQATAVAKDRRTIAEDPRRRAVAALAQAGRDHLTVQNAKPLLDLPRIGIAVVAQDSCIAN